MWLNIVCIYHGLLFQPSLAGKSIKELWWSHVRALGVVKRKITDKM